MTSTEIPASIQELREVVRHSTAVFPKGGGTLFDLGLPPSRPGITVDLTRLDRVIDYPARDMTITVEAGMTMARLQEMLTSGGQRLPIDVPFPEKATLGGSMACNLSGPRRYGFGMFRDYVIGISVVNDEGALVKAGGRVVKNVAGYDLCKLYTGSLGTLGIISQVTLKVRPQPEACVLLALTSDDNRLDSLLTTLHGSRTRPACISVLSSAAAAGTRLESDSPDHWTVVVAYEDNEQAVVWQTKQLRDELGHAVKREWSGREADPHWRYLSDYPLREGFAFTFKANLLPSRTASFLQAAAPMSPFLLAHAGNGIVHGHLAPARPSETACSVIATLRQQARAAGGSLVLLRCPEPLRQKIGVWGDPGDDWWLMGEIKTTLDPRNLFNPGRFLGGI